MRSFCLTGRRRAAASFIEEGVFCERPNSRAVVTVNLSVGYAIWAALGIVLTTIIAVAMFGEQLNGPSIVGIALIIAGVVLVNMFGPAR
ncbi:DMT family transporter [Slackia sp.]